MFTLVALEPWTPASWFLRPIGALNKAPSDCARIWGPSLWSHWDTAKWSPDITYIHVHVTSAGRVEILEYGFQNLNTLTVDTLNHPHYNCAKSGGRHHDHPVLWSWLLLHGVLNPHLERTGTKHPSIMVSMFNGHLRPLSLQRPQAAFILYQSHSYPWALI